MFKKLLSNLPFNPSLVGQVSFYAKRLRAESAIRRLSFVVLAMAMLVQLFAAAAPPESSVTASPENDFISGGIASRGLSTVRENLITAMNADTLIRTGFEYYGITESLIQGSSARIEKIYLGDAKYRSSGRKSYGYASETERQFLNGVVFYERDLRDVAINPDSYEDVLALERSDGTWVAIMLTCGNPVIDTTQTTTPPPEPPKPVTGFFDSIDCNIASGWAYDPRIPSTSITVHIYIDEAHIGTASADQPRPDVNKQNIPGNHGFSWTVPAKYRDTNPHTARVYAIENVTARGGIAEGNRLLFSDPNPRTFGPCASPSEPEIQLCRPGSGIIRINESARLKTDLAPEMCDDVVVCIKDKLITVKRYEQGTSPTVCPTIEICRDGKRILITTDKKLPSDLSPEQCNEMQVCEGTQLITIQVREYDTKKYRKPDPLLGCDIGTPKITRNKKASNLTQQLTNADGSTAKPGDSIEYILTTTNTGNILGKTIIDESLSDVLEYAEYVSSDNGSLDSDTGYITWGSVSLNPGQSLTHKVVVKVKSQIPTTPQGATASSSQSYDLIMNNVYGDTINIKVQAPTIKIVERTTQQLPNTGPGISVFIALFLTVFAGYFFTRSRLLAKELDLAKADFLQ